MLTINPITNCYCTFAQRMAGDGCGICNPQYAEELRLQNEHEDLLEGAKTTKPTKEEEKE